MSGHGSERCIVREEPLEIAELSEATCISCGVRGHVACKEPYKCEKEEVRVVEKKIVKDKEVKEAGKKKKRRKKIKDRIEEIKVRSIMYRKHKNKSMKRVLKKG